MMGDLSSVGGIAAMLAGVLMVAAIAMNSMRWLRILALVAGAAALVAVITSGAEMLVSLIVACFVIANGTQLIVLMLRGRAHHLSDEERELLEGVLEVQDPEQQRRLLGLMRWRDAAPDEVLMQQGQSRPPLVYIASGQAAIEHDEKRVGTCGAGDFLGEMSLMTGESASATVRVMVPMRIAHFDRDSLGQFTADVPELKRAFDAALNRGLAAKVLRMNKAAAASGD